MKLEQFDVVIFPIKADACQAYNNILRETEELIMEDTLAPNMCATHSPAKLGLTDKSRLLKAA